jgi:hypothetical protein
MVWCTHVRWSTARGRGRSQYESELTMADVGACIERMAAAG